MPDFFAILDAEFCLCSMKLSVNIEETYTLYLSLDIRMPKINLSFINIYFFRMTELTEEKFSGKRKH